MSKKLFNTYLFLDEELASWTVAKKIFDFINEKPDAILGLATGSTPIATYKNLIEWMKGLTPIQKQQLSNLQTFNLDEYVGLDAKHEQSYHSFMDKHLFNRLPFIKRENIHFPEEGKNYDQLIASKGGIDLQILGIGTNGHIGFNEPGSAADSVTRKVDLAKSTIEANSRFFESINDVPTQAISMGLETIMQAKTIYLLAFGESKNEAVQKLLKCEKFDPKFPASILVTHPDFHLFVDEEAVKKSQM